MAKYICKCKMCGKDFENYNKDSKFCSRKCYDEFRRENSKLKVRQCLMCGNNFQPSRSEQMFCSVECRIKSTENRIECICEYCGGIFERKKSEVDKNKHHYCSIECRNNAMWWSDDDTEILRENYGKISYNKMINLFSTPKTAEEIKRRAVYIGLTSSRKWSSDEIKILIDNYSDKPINEVMELLPNRTKQSILRQAYARNLKSFFYINHKYTEEEDDYLKNNYLSKTNEELGIILNRSPNGISQHLLLLGLYRPVDINNYNTISTYIRKRIYPWRNRVLEQQNYACELTGSTNNTVVHHIHGFNLILKEAIDEINFPIYDRLDLYSKKQLDTLLYTFLSIQDDYNSYICIDEKIHKHFHTIYGYGNNTKIQWNKFIDIFYK